MAYFPMFVNLKDQPCLVVGGGMVAYRKVKVLLDFEARVVVVGENICDKINEIVKKSNQLELQKKCFEDADCDIYMGAAHETPYYRGIEDSL